MRERKRKPSGVRKTRSDKRTEIRPTILATDYEMISMLAFICDKKNKDVVESLVLEGLSSKDIEYRVAKRFVRPLTLTNHVYYGEAKTKYRPTFDHPTERPSGRFLQPVIDLLDGYAFALGGCSRSAATGLVLQETLHDSKHVMRLIFRTATGEMSKERRRDLLTLIRALKKESEPGWTISVSALLAFLAEECVNAMVTVKEVVGRFLGETVGEIDQQNMR